MKPLIDALCTILTRLEGALEALGTGSLEGPLWDLRTAEEELRGVRVAAARYLLDDGLCVSDVAAITGLGRRTVTALAPPTARVRSADVLAAAEALSAAGRTPTPAAVAEATGLPRKAVARALERARARARRGAEEGR